ncbi:hypothetical protein BDA96_01G361100 [Sorghum bicolor]|uniref:Uncharacterized protein n=1 Tax=Sorghum bicolor TaxID=4558 RepID=A0A921S383_SORBI|nr:hypothetical protein BDA96_01G361100 [Sorghum bicolor]
MGAAASIIALHPTMCSAAAAVCPPVVGVAAGVFGVGVALGATAAVCPPVVPVRAARGTAPAPWDSAVVFPANASGALPALVDASASELLAARAAWRASEVMAVLETLKPLEEKLGANIPREAKSCICVMAAAAGVCLDVFKPPTGGSVGGSSGLRTRGGAVAEPRFRGHGTSNRRAVQ